jgi:hypothetical protein
MSDATHPRKGQQATPQHNYTFTTGHYAGCKMLASTMQISNNNPTNTLNHQPVTSSKGRNRKPNHTPPPDSRQETASVQLIPQDPTVCLTPSPTNAGP